MRRRLAMASWLVLTALFAIVPVPAQSQSGSDRTTSGDARDGGRQRRRDDDTSGEQRRRQDREEPGDDDTTRADRDRSRDDEDTPTTRRRTDETDRDTSRRTKRTKRSTADTDEPEDDRTKDSRDRTGKRDTRKDRSKAGATSAEDEKEKARLKRIQRFYGRRATEDLEDQALESLLDEIEAEAGDELPLFGQVAFRQAIIARASSTQQNPISTPPPSYRLLPGDQMAITFWNPYVEPQTAKVAVAPDGNISFVPVGAVQVAGMTAREFEEIITRLIRRRGPREASVRVSYIDLHALRVSVGGEVRRPSANVIITGYGTVYDAIAAAGGPRSMASLRRVRLYRDGKMTVIDLYGLLLEGDPKDNLSLRDGDGIYVPVAERLVGVDGEVSRPARYELLTEQTVRDALRLAGGLRSRAARLQLRRIQDRTDEAIFDFGAREVLAGTASTAKLEPLRHGDTVMVLELGGERSVVTVKGAFGREGEYGAEPGMTLGDLMAKAQGVQQKGYRSTGLIKRPRREGGVETISFEVAEVRRGGPAARIGVQAGDTVEIPFATGLPPVTVVVSGAVSMPGAYTFDADSTVADALTKAGGVGPGAATHGIVISRGRDGQTEQRVDLSGLSRGDLPKPNPYLQNGDQLLVPLLTDVGQAPRIVLEGMVRKPGRYPLTVGMKLSDALVRAGGIVPRAGARGQVTRAVSGSANPEVFYFDVAKMVAGSDPMGSLALQDEDVIRVPSSDEVARGTQARVTINGPVGQPGHYPRHQGMTVRDLIVTAGGLKVDADRDAAYIIRRTESGHVRFVRFSPAGAMRNTPEHNPVLEDEDLVEVVPWQEVRATPRSVRVSGAVHFPGLFPLGDNMTVEDLLHLAAGTTPDAYLPRAELRRRAANGRWRVIPFDLSIRPQLMPLEDGDQLRVFTHQQAVYSEARVEIKGEVQRPGRYERTDSMTLSDLIFRAGGLTRNVAFTACEVARARDTRTVIIRPDLRRMLAGDKTQDLELEDGDSVFVQTLGEYKHRAREVLLRGRLALPGFFPLAGTEESLRQILTDRAKGVLPGAFIEGAVLLRRVDEVVDAEVARYGSDVFHALRVRRIRDDYALVLSKGVTSPPEWLGQGERVLPVEMVPSKLADDLGESRDLTRIDSELELMERSRYGIAASGQRKPSAARSSTRSRARASERSQSADRDKGGSTQRDPRDQRDTAGEGRRRTDRDARSSGRASERDEDEMDADAPADEDVEDREDTSTPRTKSRRQGATRTTEPQVPERRDPLGPLEPTGDEAPAKDDEARAKAEAAKSQAEADKEAKDTAAQTPEDPTKPAKVRTPFDREMKERDELPRTPRVLRHYVRVALDLQAVLEGREDLQLRPNDILVVPEMPHLVLVQGEVVSNMAQPFTEGKAVDHYVRRCGGLTRNADVAGILVVRANGSITAAGLSTTVRRGDMVLVLPRPLTLPRERRATEDLQAIAGVIGGFATTLLALTQAVK